MKNKFKTILTVTLFAIGLFASHAFASDYAIVVNENNSASADISEIKNLYLKKKTSWSNGTEAVPLGRPADSPEHQAFMTEVLGFSSQGALDSYWQSEKSKTGLTGPREVGSTSILMRQITRKPGAFGVLPTAEANALPAGVKILTSF